MPQKVLQPNPENASIHDLRAAFRAGSTETQTRIMALIMLLTGIDRAQVCKTLFVGVRAVRKWIAAFNRSGIDGLIAKKRPGAPKKIPSAKAETLLRDIEQPEAAKRTFWTAKAFHGHITHKYGVECSYDTVRRFFHEKGFALKVPRPWPDRQDEHAREAFREKLRVMDKDPDVEIWFADETGIEGEPKPRRRWAKKGSTPHMVKNGDHIRLNIMGMVCPRTGEFAAIESPHSDSEWFQTFLDEAAKMINPQRTRNVLILDNASWHKKKTLNWHFFEPLYLPPYSPDLNPIERLWLVMKAEWFNNIHCKTYEALMDRADLAILDLINQPQRVAKTTSLKGT
jgi:transposase